MRVLAKTLSLIGLVLVAQGLRAAPGDLDPAFAPPVFGALCFICLMCSFDSGSPLRFLSGLGSSWTGVNVHRCVQQQRLVGRWLGLALGLTVASVPQAGEPLVRQWVGGSGDWFSANKWLPAGVPGEGDTVTIGSNTGVITATQPVVHRGWLVLEGGTLAGGPYRWDQGAKVIWRAGYLDGSHRVEPQALVEVEGLGTKYLRGVLTNLGVVRVVDSQFTVWSPVSEPVSLVNGEGSILEFVGASALRGFTGAGGRQSLVNHGLVRKVGAGDDAFIDSYPYDLPFTNRGIVRVEGGRLGLRGLVNSGWLGAEAGAELLLNGHQFVLESGSTIGGDGTNRWVNGEYFLSGNLSVTNLILNPADAGPDIECVNARIHGKLTWASGRFAGAMTLAQGSMIDMVPGGSKFILGAFTNEGTVHLKGTVWMQERGTTPPSWINQPGAVTEVSDYAEFGNLVRAGDKPTIVNRGTLRLLPTTTGFTVQTGIRFLNERLIECGAGATVFYGDYSTEDGTIALGMSGAFRPHVHFRRYDFSDHLVLQGADGYVPTMSAPMELISFDTRDGHFQSITFPPIAEWTSGYDNRSFFITAVAPSILPVIAVAPVTQTVTQGASVTLTVVVTNTTAATYQWFKDDTALTGQTGSNLHLNQVQTADSGNYTVRVSNAAGSELSSPANLTVQPPPSPYYTFDALNAGEAELAGQDGWEVGRSAGSARVRAVTGGIGNRVHVGPGSFAFTLRQALRFDLPALTGQERRVTVQLDLNFAAESGQLPPPQLGPPEGSGVLWGKRTGSESQPGEAAGFLVRSSTLINLGLGSQQDWYRVRVVADLADPVGSGSTTTYVQNLSRGDTVWTSLGRVSLKLNEMSPQSRPPSWDTVALVLMDGVEADNLLVQVEGEAMPVVPEFDGNIPQPVQTRMGTPLAQVIGVTGADAVTASGLPGWLTFDAGTRTLQGTAPEGSSGNVTVVLTASNAEGRAVMPVTVQMLWPEAQTITFEPIADKYTDDAPFTVTASASSGLPVTLTVVSGPATVSENTVALTGAAGTVVLRAEQSGGSGWAAAPSQTASFVVSQRILPPVADAGGPYALELEHGSGLLLNANLSRPGDPARPIRYYRWDLNRDGSYDTQDQVAFTSVSAAQLEAAGIRLPGSYTLLLEVEDSLGQKASATATLVVTLFLSLPTALDAPLLYWVTYGASPWFAQTEVTHDELDAARSGAVTDDHGSALQAVVLGPGTLTWWWKVSSETNYDYLHLWLDFNPQARISGELGWRQESLLVPEGVHTIEWVYTKDEAVSAGADAGWVDQVVFTPSHTNSYAVLSAASSGWFASGMVRSSPEDTRYPVGELFYGTNAMEFRSWFEFRIPALPGPIIEANLRIFSGEIANVGGDEVFQLRSVESSPSVLRSGAASAPIFGDLADGEDYGRLSVNSDLAYEYLNVPLTSAAMRAVHASVLNGDFVFLLGASISSLNTIPGDGEYLFAADNSPGNVQLVLRFGTTIDMTPVAHAGGPYSIAVGESLTLDASASHHLNPAGVLTGYGWDLDQNGTLDITGSEPVVTLTAAQLSSLGINAPGAYPIRLWVQDEQGRLADARSSVSVTGGMVRTWNGGSGDWFTASNWTPAGVPSTYDTVMIGGGTVLPSRVVVHSGVIHWTAGTLAGSWSITSAGRLELAGLATGPTMVLSGTLTNAGSVLWKTGKFSLADQNLGAPTLINEAGGIFEVAGDYALSFGITTPSLSRSIINRGTFRKSAGLGRATVVAAVPFNNFGTVECLSGTLEFSSSAFLPQGGTLASGLRSATDYGVIEFTSGNIDLRLLRFAATLLDGFVPTFPADFLPIRYASRTGGFVSAELPAIGAWEVHYLSTSYHLGTRRDGPATMLYQPQDVLGSVRDDLTLAAAASGTDPVAYQWQRAGQDIPGATNQELAFPAARFEDTGLYTVVVSNALGSVTSQPARLEVVSKSRVIDTITMSGDTSRQFLNILSTAWTVADTNYVLTMEMAAPLPLAAEMTTGRRIDLMWFVDADRNRATGQSALGNDYNIHMYLHGGGWNVAWFKVSPVATGDGVTINANRFQMQVHGRFASLIVPRAYLPSQGFEFWSRTTSEFSTNWPPTSRHQETPRATVLAPSFPRVAALSPDANVIRGDFLFLATQAGGSEPFRYQWFLGTNTLAGKLLPSFMLPSVAPADAGDYFVRVSNDAGWVQGGPVRVSIRAPQPQTIAFLPLTDRYQDDMPFALEATASSGLPVSFEVVSGPASVSGSGSALTLSGLTGQVVVRASQVGGNGYAAAEPVERSFVVYPILPVITRSPASTNVMEGLAVRFTFDLVGRGPFSYQWFRDLQQLENETGPTLTIDPVLPSHAGAYKVRVTNQAGSAESDPAELTVRVNPAPVAHAGGPYSIDLGAALSLSGTQSFDPEPEDSIVAYAWDLDGDGAYDDAGGDALTVSASRLTDLGLGRPGTYPIALEVTDSRGKKGTAATTLTVRAIVHTFDGLNAGLLAGQDGWMQVSRVGAGAQVVPAPGGGQMITVGSTSAEVLCRANGSPFWGATGELSLQVDLRWDRPEDATAFSLVVGRDQNQDGELGRHEAVGLAYAEGWFSLALTDFLAKRVSRAGGELGNLGDWFRVRLVLTQINSQLMAARFYYRNLTRGDTAWRGLGGDEFGTDEVHPEVGPSTWDVLQLSVGKGIEVDNVFVGVDATPMPALPLIAGWKVNPDPVAGVPFAYRVTVRQSDTLELRSGPPWLSFNPSTLELFGTAGPGTHFAHLVARNALGESDASLVLEVAEPRPQTITFEPIADKFTDDTPFTVMVSASSGMPVTLTVVSGPATVSGNTVTLSGQPGTVVLRAEQGGGSGWAAATLVEWSFAVHELSPQTITFEILGDRYLDEPPISLIATASSGLPVSFEVVSGPASVSGSALTLSGLTGQVVVRALQAGGNSYAAAEPVERSFVVYPILPVITRSPTSTNVMEGLAIRFTFDLVGRGPFSYQWFRDLHQLENETGPTLTIDPVLPSHAGAYKVRVTNQAGSAESDPAQLTVRINPLPVANAGGPYTIIAGSALNLAGGQSYDPEPDDPIVGYAWDLDHDGAFDDATGDSVTIGPASLSALGLNRPDTYTLGLEVTDSRGGKGTATTTLTVQPAVYTFDNLNVGALAGQDGWISLSVGGVSAQVVAAPQGGRVAGMEGNGVEILMRGNDLRFALPRLLGTESQAVLEFDFRSSRLQDDASLFGLQFGHALSAESGLDGENAIGFRFQNGYFKLEGIGGPSARVASRAGAELGGIGDWFRIRIVLDLSQTPVANLALYYRNLTRGDAAWRGLSRKGLDTRMLKPGARPADWDTVQLLLSEGCQVDNLALWTDEIVMPAVPWILSPEFPSPQPRVGELFSYRVEAAGATRLEIGALPPWLSFDPATATLSGSPSEAGLVRVHLIAANDAGQTDGSLTLNVQPLQHQTLTFDAVPDKFTDDASFTVTASASSGLPVTVTVVSGPATVSGNTVTLTGATGTVTLRAEQAGGNGYIGATPVERSFEVRVRTCVTAPMGLVAWWPGEGDASDLVGASEGTLQNGATFSPGRVGQSFSLDGVDDYVTVGMLPELRDATSLTVMAWINLANYRNTQASIVGKWNSFPTVNDNSFLLSCEGEWISGVGPSGELKGMFALNFNDSTGDYLLANTLLPTNQWAHVAATWRSSDGVTIIYKNGVADGQSTIGIGKTLRYHENYPAVIGELGVIRESRYKFPGQIDEVAIISRALSGEEIQSIFNAGSAGMCQVAVPEVVRAPEGTNVVAGGTLVLSVEAVGTPPLRYQWLLGTDELSGQTNAVLSIEDVEASDAGDYFVRVTNNGGSVLSGPAQVTVAQPPSPYYTFDALDAGEAELAGQDGWEVGRSAGSARVSAVAGGTGNRVHVGRSGFAFTLRPASRFELPALTGQERRVTVQLDLNFAAESGQLPPPQLGPPEGSGVLWGKRTGSEVPPGEAAGFLVRSSTLINLGLGSLADWYRVRVVADLADPVGSGSTTTFVQNLSRGDTVWTSLGRVSLKLNEMSPQSRPPSWDTVALVLMDGVEADNLLVQAEGESMPTLPEFSGNIPQPVLTRIGTPLAQVIGVTGADAVTASGLPGWLTFDAGTRTLQGTAPEGSSGHVNVVLTASNALGRAVMPVTVQVLWPEAQTITFEPIADKFTDDAPFTVAASASSGLPVTLAVVSGPATVSGNTLTLTGATGTVVLRAEQGGGNGWAAAVPQERSFGVGVRAEGPRIVAGPLSRVVLEGSRLELEVVATGTEPLAYQWFMAGEVIPDATNRILVFPSVQADQQTRYWVRITNSVGSATSGHAIVLLGAESFDFSDHVLAGWSKEEPFCGELRISHDGNPGGALEVLDTETGCGGLLVRAPEHFSGNLARFVGMAWDEWIPSTNSADWGTHLELVGVDGTRLRSSRLVPGQLGSWQPRMVLFQAGHWSVVDGPGTFGSVITNVSGLFIQMDTSGGELPTVEARVDNIRLLRTPECVPAPSDLVALWRGEGNVRDAYSTNHGVAGSRLEFATGKVGQAFRFVDVAESSIGFPDTPGFQPTNNQLTISAWVKPDYRVLGDRVDTVFAKRDHCTGLPYSYGFWILKGWNGHIGTFTFGMMPQIGNVFSTKPIPNDGGFHHIAVTYDGNLATGNCVLYLNGEEVGRGHGPGPIPVSPVGPRSGATPCNNSMTDIDELAFFGRALSAGEIVSLYVAGSTGMCLELRGQEITFEPIADKFTDDAPFTVTASASSGLPVTLTLVSGPATVSGSTVTLTGATGTVTLRAEQAGGSGYNGATPVERSFMVNVRVVEPVALEAAYGPEGFVLTLRGPIGGTWMVQWSENLKAWADLRELTDFSGAAAVVDPVPPTRVMRYYRAVRR